MNLKQYLISTKINFKLVKYKINKTDLFKFSRFT